MLLTKIGRLDELLQRHATVLGNDAAGYRNHVYRVINFCHLITPLDAMQCEKVAIAGAFHDLGIWTDKTFDYLEPSERLAQNYLAEIDRQDWCEEVTAMIHDHHKLTCASTRAGDLVEVFRQADWIDVTLGLVACGLSRQQRRTVFRAFPDEGFHRRLIQLSLKRLITHPLSPLPMMRR